MSDKTLGQVAYEAHTPDYRVPFCELSESFQCAWQAAADAVVAAAEHPDWHAHYERMKAVIEAARELLWISRHYRLDSTEGKVAAAKVIQVTGALEEVQALEAAEKSDE